MESGTSSTKADHLCVLVHGLWGNPQHLAYLAKTLGETYGEDQLHVLVAKNNSGSFTYDGIETGGERLTHEIEDELETLARRGQTIKKISVVGYSLGGVIARYAIGLLYSKGWFDKLEPVNFTTFATPHLGVRTPLLGYHNHLWNVLGARSLSMSGRQLFMIDSFRDTGKPLLAVLADPDSVFIKGLARFRHRSLYSNIVNDRSAVYYTTCISRTDPFVNLSDINLNYLPGYEPIILDPDNPVSPKPKDGENLPSFYERMRAVKQTLALKLPLYLFFTLIVPIGTVVFLINSGIQSVRSAQRIRLHEEGKAGIEAQRYRIPLIMNEMRQSVEEAYEELPRSAMSQEYLPDGSGEFDNAPNKSLLSGKDVEHGSDAVEKPAAENIGMKTTDVGTTKDPKTNRKMEFPTLALTPAQFAMIQALDDVGFRKFPVHIHNVNHSHAAIIVRMLRDRFAEGKVVVRHWVEHFKIE